MVTAKVRWSDQVEAYVRSKAPVPRRELWQGIKALATWNGREQEPRIRHLEDELSAYSRLRVRGHRVIFREACDAGERQILCLFAGPRKTVYEAFEELLLDELTLPHPSGQPPTG